MRAVLLASATAARLGELRCSSLSSQSECWPRLSRACRTTAIAPVSGYSDVDEPCRLKTVPVWAFHGAADGIVPIGREQPVVDAAKACGVNIHYTVYPGVGHFIWERTYNDPDLYSWFLRYRRPLLGLPALERMPRLRGFSRPKSAG